MTVLPVPSLSWPEAADPEAEQAAIDRICTLVGTGLPPLGPGHTRLLLALPTPAPYAVADAALRAALPPGARVRSLSWPPHGHCYAAEGMNAWRQLLPLVFRLGPPELTLLVLQGDWHLDAPAAGLLQAMKSVLADLADAGVVAHVGLHFDSGDLRQRF